jgi:hypothetical protein
MYIFKTGNKETKAVTSKKFLGAIKIKVQDIHFVPIENFLSYRI